MLSTRFLFFDLTFLAAGQHPWAMKMSNDTFESEMTANVDGLVLDSRLLARAKREEIQRKCAIKRHLREWRSLPKRERERLIEGARRVKFELARPQAGFAAMLGAGAVGASLGFACGSSVAPNVAKVAEAISGTVEQVGSAASSVGSFVDGARGVVDYLQSLVSEVASTARRMIGGLWKIVYGSFVIAMRALFGLSGLVSHFFDAIVSSVCPDITGALQFEEGDVYVEPQSFGLLPSIVSLVS